MTAPKVLALVLIAAALSACGSDRDHTIVTASPAASAETSPSQRATVSAPAPTQPANSPAESPATSDKAVGRLRDILAESSVPGRTNLEAALQSMPQHLSGGGSRKIEHGRVTYTSAAGAETVLEALPRERALPPGELQAAIRQASQRSGGPSFTVLAECQPGAVACLVGARQHDQARYVAAWASHEGPLVFTVVADSLAAISDLASALP